MLTTSPRLTFAPLRAFSTLTLFSAMRTLARENTHASAMIAEMSRYMRLPIDSAHSRKKPKHVARVALAFFTGRDSFRVEWAAPGRSAQAQGNGNVFDHGDEDAFGADAFHLGFGTGADAVSQHR